MTHIAALCHWHCERRDMRVDTSCCRFVSLPLKTGTATNAFPLQQNGPPASCTSVQIQVKIQVQTQVQVQLQNSQRLQKASSPEAQYQR